MAEGPPRRNRPSLPRWLRPRTAKGRGVRNLLVEIGLVLLIFAGTWAYTAQPFPGALPLVVVESESMMHGPRGPCLTGTQCADYSGIPFGRVGTIDPGDLVLVKRVSTFGDVETAFGGGSRDGYGGHGDVLVFRRDGSGAPIIHRAMLLVRAEPDGCQPNGFPACKYVIPETCNEQRFATFVQPRQGSSNWRAYCRGSSQPITLDLERDGLFLRLEGYPCANQRCPAMHSGFITKGDNNRHADQPVPMGGGGGVTCCPVPLDRIVGKARGEVPWFGLIKLAVVGNPAYHPELDPAGASQWRVGAARAPSDVWLALGLSLGVVLTLPALIDLVVQRVQKRRARTAATSEVEAPPPVPAVEEISAPRPATKAPSRKPRPRPTRRG
jgi:signal peptidase I